MVFDSLLAGGLLSVVAIGHFGLWIWLYNRINSTGLKRTTIKRIEKAIVLSCCTIPILLVAIEISRRVGDSSQSILGFHAVTLAYFVLVSIFAFVMAPFWIADRPQLAIARNRYEVISTEEYTEPKKSREELQRYIVGSHFRRMAMLPGNQIVSLERNHKRLLISDLPADLVGLRIAHLSDVHLTGQLSTSFYRLVVDWISEQSPDMVVLSGDIVDYAIALPQLKQVFQGLQAPLGCYFILGNHDKRLANPTDVCRELCELGWSDLGVSEAVVQRGKTRVEILGNELPWFRRHLNAVAPQKACEIASNWRIGVAHSPDQFRWATQSRCGLLLCGHTHGGQIRLPVVGPVVAPSWYGARYASGVFLRHTTMMHVSKGVSGVHPYRWGCMPEVSILELAAMKN